MKKFLMLLIASVVAIPCFAFGGDVVVNTVSSMNNQCNPLESNTYWIYLNNSKTYYPYDNFRNDSANSYITIHNSSFVGTKVEIWKRNSSVLSNCSNWKRTSSAVPQNQTKMVIQNQDGCKFNIPTYTKKNNPSAVDVQLHYRIGFTQFNYGNHHITDHLYYTTYNGNIYCFGNSTNPVSNGSNCDSTTISYSQEYFHNNECLNYKLFWCGDGLVNSETGTSYNNGNFSEVCDDGAQNGQPGKCNTSCNGYVPSGPVCGNGVLEAGEQCEKVNGSFLPGCSNCQLQTPSCSVTVNPNHGNVPKNVTVTTSNVQSWAIVEYINMGIGSNIYNPTFPYTFTYSNPGTYQIKVKVRSNYGNYYNAPYSGDLSNIKDYCYAYFTGTNPAPYCGDGIINQSSEDCDPGSGHFRNGCNSSCKLMTPSCSLTANPSNGNIPLNTSINGTTNAWWGRIVYLNFGDGQIIGNGRDGISFPKNHIYSITGTFYITGQVLNIYTPIRTGATRPVAYCSVTVTTTNPTPDPYCGDGILQSNEQCDPGSGHFGNGCTSGCMLMTPTCTLTVNPSNGNIPLNTTASGTKPSWAIYTNLDFGDGQQASNPSLPKNHLYNSVGTFNLTLTVQNNYNGQIHGTKPTATCSATVHTNQPPQGRLTIQKTLLTTGSFPAGSLVAYKIVLKNIGSGIYHNAFIEDVMPKALQYVSSNIQGIGNSYQFSEWNDTNGQHHVKYYNFDLSPNQQAILYLTGRIRQGYSSDETMNCAYTNSGLNSCANFVAQPTPYVKKWQKVGNMAFTDQVLNVGIGDSIVYKVDFANLGGSSAIGIVKDYLPNCVDFVDSSIHGVTGATFVANTDYSVIIYKNFYLAAGQTGYMLVTGQINGDGSCAGVTGYLNTGSFKFTNTQEMFSTVKAIRPENTTPSVVLFDKTGNKSIMHPGETGLEFYITVTNQGPNTISNVYVEDLWPDNESCIIYDGWTGDLIEEVSHLRWHYLGVSNGGGNRGTSSNGNGGRGSNGGKGSNNNGGGGAGTNVDPMGKLYAGQSFSFTIFAHVANNPSCTGHYINTGVLTYIEGGDPHEMVDDYPFQVVAAPNIHVTITKTVDHQHVHHGEYVKYTITYTNDGNVALSNYIIRDYWPAMLQFVTSNPITNDVVTTSTGSIITWHFNTPLGVGESHTITATGLVL